MPKPFGIILKVRWEFLKKFLQLPKERNAAFIVYDSPPELLDVNDVIFFRSSYENRGVWSYSRFIKSEDVDGYFGFGTLKRGERKRVRNQVKKLLKTEKPIMSVTKKIRGKGYPYIADRMLRADKALKELKNKYGRQDSEAWTEDKEGVWEWTLKDLMGLGDGPRGVIIFDYIREIRGANDKHAVMSEEDFYKLFSIDPSPPGVGYRYLTLEQVKKIKQWFEKEKKSKLDFEVADNKVHWTWFKPS